MVDVLVTGRMIAGGTRRNIKRERSRKYSRTGSRTKVEQDREGKPQTFAVITLLVTPMKRRS